MLQSPLPEDPYSSAACGGHWEPQAATWRSCGRGAPGLRELRSPESRPTIPLRGGHGLL